MMQSNSFGPSPNLAVYNACVSHAPRKKTPVSRTKQAAPVPSRFLELFEEVTGWVVQFSESRSSVHQRQLPGTDDLAPVGDLAIVDLSDLWPAQIPMGHRAKCDEMVSMLGAMSAELHATRQELAQTRSVLEGLSPGAEDEDVILVDSFIPTHSRIDDTCDQWRFDPYGERIEQQSRTEDDFFINLEAIDRMVDDELAECEGFDIGVFQTIPSAESESEG